ncbi:MAG TPA: DUF222 domain-containing protein [Acidimicrobiales bacterium]|nr:DUF222 domain-containing protein [Acidimicrobiales bacterium]
MDEGRWLVERSVEMDRAESVWLEKLAEFDRSGQWALDGHLCCATWLMWRLKMARSTAFEKLRVAHELARRPVVAEAFREGRVSYSVVRAITRMERPDPDVDRALVELAESDGATIFDVERVVRSYQLYAEQERPPAKEVDRCRGVGIRRGCDGTGTVMLTLSDVELEEFAATFQAFLDLRFRDQPVDESSGADGDQSRESRRADAFMDLVRTALDHADGGRAAGDDRYMVHLVRHQGSPMVTLLDGTPVEPVEGSMICCDASTVAHAVSDTGEPLRLGRKTREWSTAQRRAINVRDGGRCRFVGCRFTHTDVHHILPWENGGPTDIDNGMSACPRHHHKLHAGFGVAGDPNGDLRFYRPDGSYIGSTHPVSHQPALPRDALVMN